MKIGKKIVILLLAVSFLLNTAITAVAIESEGTETTNDSGISALMNAASVNPLTGTETAPFVSAPDSSVLMSKENELLLYTSNKKGLSAKDDFVTVFEKMNEGTSYTGESEVSPELDLFFVTAVRTTMLHISEMPFVQWL